MGPSAQLIPEAPSLPRHTARRTAGPSHPSKWVEAEKEGVASMKRSLFAVAVAIAAVLSTMALAACSATLPNEPPGIEGVVTSVDAGGAGASVYLVEVPEAERGGETAAEFVSDKAAVTVDADTALFDADGGTDGPVTIGVGTRVRVWFEGPVAESYPVQGRAKAVQVLGEEPPGEQGDAGVLELTAADDASSQTLAAGQTVQVSLEANPSTGYAWAIDGEAPAFLEQTGEPVFTPESDALGAGGTEVWTFRATGAGAGTLALKYWRSFEPDVEPERTFSVEIAVE